MTESTRGTRKILGSIGGIHKYRYPTVKLLQLTVTYCNCITKQLNPVTETCECTIESTEY